MTHVTRPTRPLRSLVIAASTVVLEGRGSYVVDLRIPAASRLKGGPFELRLTGPDVELTGHAVEWLVSTNRGWTHFLGTARRRDGAIVPLRCDIFSAVGAPGAMDIAVFRVYEPTANPALDGPVARFRFELPAGSIRLGD